MIKNRIQCGVINIHLLTALGLRLNTIRDPVAKVRKKNLTCTNISAQLLPNLSKKDIFICAYAKKMYLCAGFLNKQSKFNEHGSTITMSSIRYSIIIPHKDISNQKNPISRISRKTKWQKVDNLARKWTNWQRFGTWHIICLC